MGTYLLQVVKSASLPFAGLATWYNRTAVAEPFKTAVSTSLLKTSAADIFAQKAVERKDSMDWQRNAVYSSFGFFYLGCFQYYLYNIKFAKWCQGFISRFGKIGMPVVKVGIDQFLHHPFVYFPIFYLIKGAVKGEAVQESYNKYRSEIWESCKALWAIWLPAQLINFSVVPRHLRVPYVAFVSFGWTTVLSVMQAKFDQGENPIEAAKDHLKAAVEV